MSQTRTVRGPYRNGIERRRQILATASEVFATYGYVAGSLRQIALEVGVTPAALARHFDSKEDLLIAVMQYWEEQTARTSLSSATGLAYFDGLKALMRYHVAHRGYLELFLTLSTEASNPQHPAGAFVRDRYARMLERFTTQLSSAVRKGEAAPMDTFAIEAECRTLISVMDGLELQWLLDDSVDLVGIFDRHLDVMVSRWSAAN